MWDQPTILASYRVSPARPLANVDVNYRHEDEVLASCPIRAPQHYDPMAPHLLQKDVPVEDRLLQAQRTYATRREERQAAQRAVEIREVTGRPTISRRSDLLVQKASGTPVYERLAAHHAAAKVGREARAAVAKEERRQQEPAPEPRINDRSRAITPRGAAGFADWEQKRQQRLAKKARQVEQEELAATTLEPSLNPKSRTLAAQRRGQYSSGPAVPIEDTLLQWEEDRERRLALQRHRQEVATAAAMLPRVDCSNQAADRLYADAATRASTQSRRELENDLLECIDEQTGQILFTPAVTPLPSVPARYLDGVTTPHGARRVADQGRKEESGIVAPKINPYSRLLAELRFARAGTDVDVAVHERLAGPKQRQGAPRVDKSAFKPQLDPRSVRLDRARTPVTSRRGSLADSGADDAAARSRASVSSDSTHGRRSGRSGTPTASATLAASHRAEILLAKKQQYQAHIERLRYASEEEERRRCTWTPKTNRRACRGHDGEDPTHGATFLDRQRLWAARREAKLTSKRLAEQEAAEEDVG